MGTLGLGRGGEQVRLYFSKRGVVVEPRVSFRSFIDSTGGGRRELLGLDCCGGTSLYAIVVTSCDGGSMGFGSFASGPICATFKVGGGMG